MTYRRTPYPSRIARPAAPATGFAVGRSRWRDLVAEARKQAAAIIAAEGAVADPLDLTPLRRLELQTGKLNLPAELGTSATHAQIAFAATLKGVLVVELLTRRLAFARALLEAARLVDQLLDEAADAEADRTWRRQEPD
jgi:hypothetical protein